MIDEKDIERLTERLVERIEEANIYFLKQIGNNIKQFKGLSSSDAHKLSQILKYNGNYNEIINKISKLTNINIKEIDEIFSEFAKTDQRFFKEFYEYRNIKFIPYNENKALINQVKALATITKQEMYNFSRTQALGYSIRDLYGNVKFTGLKETYNKVLDEAVLNVSRGVDTFDNAMSRIMKDIGESGLKTLDFESGRSIRLDSMVRQHLQNSLRNLHNEMQKEFGKEFGSDGIEVSHHQNSAPDHIDTVDGKQFSNEEFEKVNNSLQRPVGELNCYHYIFPIILGVSKPEYTKEQLEEDKKKNKDGFEIDGKHYTLYEGTQLQRRLETEIRKTKDTQIIAKASGNKELVTRSQKKITQLTQKYNELSKTSGLPTKLERARVSGYKRTNVNKFNKDDFLEFNPNNAKEMQEIGEKYFNFKSNESLDKYVSLTSNMKSRIQNGDSAFKQTLDKLETKIDPLAEPSQIDFKLYSAKDVTIDYSKDKHLLSASISKTIANIHNNKKINKETITIYVEKGAKIISTYNTKNKQFARQAEIILPTDKKMKRIDKYNYILKK